MFIAPRLPCFSSSIKWLADWLFAPARAYSSRHHIFHERHSRRIHFGSDLLQLGDFDRLEIHLKTAPGTLSQTENLPRIWVSSESIVRNGISTRRRLTYEIKYIVQIIHIAGSGGVQFN